MPTEFLMLYLCRDVFHCTPSELRKQDPADVLAVITCLEADAEVREQESKAKP
jgi:hypothetical protein